MDKSMLSKLMDDLAQQLRHHQFRLVTAESCTGGWISKVCTDVTGSSDWFECGFVTYSNQAKQDMLEVSEETLTLYGAVSEATAAEMARGAIANSQADVAVAVTGIAGPGGATEDKPVGMVCFGWIVPERDDTTQVMYFEGNREAVRSQTVEHALKGLLQRIPPTLFKGED